MFPLNCFARLKTTVNPKRVYNKWEKLQRLVWNAQSHHPDFTDFQDPFQFFMPVANSAKLWHYVQERILERVFALLDKASF